MCTAYRSKREKLEKVFRYPFIKSCVVSESIIAWNISMKDIHVLDLSSHLHSYVLWTMIVELTCPLLSEWTYRNTIGILKFSIPFVVKYYSSLLQETCYKNICPKYKLTYRVIKINVHNLPIKHVIFRRLFALTVIAGDVPWHCSRYQLHFYRGTINRPFVKAIRSAMLFS